MRLLTAGVAVAAALPAALALGDPHLGRGAPAALVVSTAAGALAVSALALQPFLVARLRAFGRGAVRHHRLLGAVALTLVLVHVGGLFLVEVDDALFALSPDGPTRARMALFATMALICAVALGVLRPRLPMADRTWSVLHAYLASVAIVLGIAHAVLTDGALDGIGTVLLIAFGAAGLLGAAYAHVARRRRR